MLRGLGSHTGPFSPHGQVRIVAFSSKFPILLFAEDSGHVHVVDMRTWTRQVIMPPPYDIHCCIVAFF